MKTTNLSPILEIIKVFGGFIWQERRPSVFRTSKGKIYLPIHWMKGGKS